MAEDGERVVSSLVTIGRSCTIQMAHLLEHHRGNCKAIHGHTYRFALELTGVIPPYATPRFLMDFGDLKTVVFKPLNDLLDHALLVTDRVARQCSGDLLTLHDKLSQFGGIQESLGIQLRSRYPYDDAIRPMAAQVRVAIIYQGLDTSCEDLALWFAAFAASKIHQHQLDRDDWRVRKVRAQVFETIQDGAWASSEVTLAQ